MEYEVACTRCGNIVATVPSELNGWADGAIQAVLPALKDIDCGVCGVPLREALVASIGEIRMEHLYPDERPFLDLAAVQGDVHTLLLRLTRERKQAELVEQVTIRQNTQWKNERALAAAMGTQLEEAIVIVRRERSLALAEPMQHALDAYHKAIK